MSESQPSRFQVDLSGLIELLSQHLYSGQGVFVREMLQNAVDAVQARRRADPAYVGEIRIEVIESETAPTTILFQDDGIGLTEEEIHGFLATIGQSSKRGSDVRRPDDFLGQFGIGLLSCFMVTDEIAVITQSARDDQPAMEWRGNTDGTYKVRRLERSVPVGTQVFIRAKPGAEDFFQPARVLQSARDYGGFLDPSIQLTADGETHQINSMAPWLESPTETLGRERLLEYGKNVFERNFLDVIPLKSEFGDVTGVAYVLAEPVHAGSRQLHRVYVKDMLLSAKAHDLLPDWAFFVQCIMNSKGLRPTASREAFYDDSALEAARHELGVCLRRYLVDLAQNDPERFQRLIGVHHLAVKALAADDDECLEMFADWLPFETSLGRMTFGEYRRTHSEIRYIPSLDQFRQVAQVAASESLPVINAGYVYDTEVLERIGKVFPEIRVERFETEELADRFEELTQAERQATIEFERLADATLQRFKCLVEVAKFQPAELPALYVANQNAGFLRSIEQSKDVANDVWAGVLDNMAQSVENVYSRLYLNYRNPLVQRIGGLSDAQGLRRCVEMIYVQALLLGHFPLNQAELRLLNEGLVGLIDWALTAGDKQ